MLVGAQGGPKSPWRGSAAGHSRDPKGLPHSARGGHFGRLAAIPRRLRAFPVRSCNAWLFEFVVPLAGPASRRAARSLRRSPLKSVHWTDLPASRSRLTLAAIPRRLRTFRCGAVTLGSLKDAGAHVRYFFGRPQNVWLAGRAHLPLRTLGSLVESFSRLQVPRALETGPSDQQSSQAPLSAFFTQYSTL